MALGRFHDFAMNFSSSMTVSGASSRRGFTLTECLLSVTITATALLSVIGLLAGALGEARDSRLQTASGMMVRQLAGEARELMRVEPGSTSPREVIVLLDGAMQMLGHSREASGNLNAEYRSGSSHPVAASFARLLRVDDANDPMLERVLITMETPAAAPAHQRKVFHYATLAAK